MSSSSSSDTRRRQRQARPRRSHITQRAEALSLLMLLSVTENVRATNTTLTPRWGHAAAYIPSPPALLIQGGKTDPTSSYTYSSAPNTNEALLLTLDSSFSTLSAPFTAVDSSSAPSYAWHSFTPTAQEGNGMQFLSFGGDGGTLEAVQTSADSAWLVDAETTSSSINYTHEATSWGSQPMRRIYHSATGSSTGGKTYITGGLKDDGSGTTFSDVYSYNPTTSTFETLPSLPIGLYHHSSLLLPNGTLLALGGAYTSSSTGAAMVQPYSSIYGLDTTASTPSWTERSAGGSLPDGRRGATAVLNSDGSKAFVFGGADAALSLVYGDGWVLDLGNCQWQQVSSEDEGAGVRFDHTAVSVGNGQVLVFGGYGDGAPAEAGVHIWDNDSNSWVDSFTPSTSTSTSSKTSSASAASTATSSGESGESEGGPSLSVAATETVSKAASADDTSQQTAGTSWTSPTQSASTSTEPSSTDAGAYSHPLTTPIRVGLVLSIVGLLAAVLGACLWQYRRRQRRQRAAIIANSNWPSSGPRGRIPNGQYGFSEKGGSPILLHNPATDKKVPLTQSNWEKGAPIGLGMGAIGAGLSSISSKLGVRRKVVPSRDPYAELRDEDDGAGRSSAELGGPLRKSTRRVGNGIRLLGPRPQRDKSVYYSPLRLGSSSVHNKRPALSPGGNRDSRIHMLADEDRPRSVAPVVEEEDWEIESDQSPGRWRSARSLLDSQQPALDPFEDDDDQLGLILPPLRGGPVPTPHESHSDLGTYDEIATMSNPYSELSRNPYSDISRNRHAIASRRRSMDYHVPDLSPSDPLDLAGLRIPPAAVRQYSVTSIPRSDRSGRSGASNDMSDAEEGVLQRAQRMRHVSPTIVSPVETTYEPIKRTGSFFRRMAAGGITSLLRSHTGSSARPELNIRDPAPQPTLWPVMSKDEIGSLKSSFASPTTQHPPSSWNADALEPPRPIHSGQGPSLSSLQSARSMRGMVVVQRAPSGSSLESTAIIERSPASSLHTRRRSLAEELHDAQAGQGSDPELSSSSLAGRPSYADLLSPLMSETSSESSRTDGAKGAGHQRHGRTTGLETPGSIVFNGAEFSSPPILSSADFGPPHRSSTPSPPAVPPPTIARNLKSKEKEAPRFDQVKVDDISPNIQSGQVTSPPSSKETPKRKTSLRPVPTTPSTPTAPSSSSAQPHPKLETPHHPSAPPSGSPVPPPLVSHRRAVRDVVESINKRGGKTPLPPASLFSPASTYSPIIPSGTGQTASSSVPAPTRPAYLSGIPEREHKASGNPFQLPIAEEPPELSATAAPASTAVGATATAVAAATSASTTTSTTTANGTRTTSLQIQSRGTTMWEVMKRERLRVANPDGGRGLGLGFGAGARTDAGAGTGA